MAPLRDQGPADAGPDLLPLRPGGGISLKAVLDGIVDAVLAGHRSRQRLDAAVRVPATAVAGLSDLLAPLLAAACEAASAAVRLREVVITAVETPAALEIEVADSGAGHSPGTADLTGRLAPLAGRLGGDLTARDCPEGGTAITLRLPHRRTGSLAA
jgi:hypothetical protein